MSAFSRGVYIHTLGLEARAKRVPVAERRHQDDALAVGESSTGEPADGAVQKILVLVQLHDVIARGGFRHHAIPRLRCPGSIQLMVRRIIHPIASSPSGISEQLDRKLTALVTCRCKPAATTTMSSFHVTDADGDVAVAPRIRFPSLKVHCIWVGLRPVGEGDCRPVTAGAFSPIRGADPRSRWSDNSTAAGP